MTSICAAKFPEFLDMVYIFLEYVVEYEELLSKVEDRAGLLAIKALHQQLDDDNDGTIEPSETGDFIKADLKVIQNSVDQ